MTNLARFPAVIVPESSSVNTMVTSESYFDAEVYQLWLDGLQVEEISTHSSLADQLDDAVDSKQILMSYAADQVRTYHMLERWLCYPLELLDQPVFQLTDSCQALLLERYYSFDRAFAREVLGRKISYKSKKTFEDISERTKIKVDSCCRQHENLRRVFKAITILPGTTVKNIQSSFLLSDSLSRDYAAVAFMALYKFDFSSKKLIDYSFDDFAFCAIEMMKYWTHRGQSISQKTATSEGLTASSDGSSDLRIDRDFFYSMKEFRFLLEKDTAENLRRAISRNLPATIVSEMSPDVMRDATRMMLSIAINLHHSKMLRLLFADIVEKLFHLWKSWRTETFLNFISAFVKSAEELNEFKSRDARLSGMWRRFFGVFNACLTRLHRDPSRDALTRPAVKFET